MMGTGRDYTKVDSVMRNVDLVMDSVVEKAVASLMASVVEEVMVG